MSDLVSQTLAAIFQAAPEWDERSYGRAALLMADVRPHHWGGEALRRVAEAVLGHLQAGRAFGYATLRAESPDLARTLQAVQAAEPIENIRVGLHRIAEQGRTADVRAALRAAEGKLGSLPALTVASGLSDELSRATTSSGGHRHVSQIESVVTHLDALRERPGAVMSVHPDLDGLLRWGGLPVSESDGETVIITAASGHGKTALGVHIALHSAMQGHLTQYDVLADASAYQIRERMVHYLAGLPLQTGAHLDRAAPRHPTRPDESVRERLMWAETVLNGLPLEIDDSSPDMDQHELRVRLAQKAARGVRLSVIENLDHMRWDQREERLERRFQLGRLTEICRQSDRRTGHHTLLLAQANRAALEEGDGIPRGHHVADSDQPRRHCTILLGLLNPNVEQGGGNLSLKGHMDKNRQGRTGPFSLPASLVNPALATPGALS